MGDPHPQREYDAQGGEPTGCTRSGMKNRIALLSEHEGVVQPKPASTRTRDQGCGPERHDEAQRVVAYEVALGVARRGPALGPFGEAARRLLYYVCAEGRGERP